MGHREIIKNCINCNYCGDIIISENCHDFKKCSCGKVAEILSRSTGRKITYDKPGYLKYRSYYIKKRGLDKGYVNVTVALYFMMRMGSAKDVKNEFYNLTGKQPFDLSLRHEKIMIYCEININAFGKITYLS